MRPSFILVIAACASASGTAVAQDGAPSAETVLSTLHREHPRLLLSDARVAELKHLAESDATLKKGIAEVLADADKLSAAPALEHKLIGPRLLSVSRECLKRVEVLGFAWRITGKDDYLRAAEKNLHTVCAFADWNPSHFLDVAEMSNAVGIGYDWLYSALSAESRETIRAGLIKLGLDEGVKAEGGWDGNGKPAWWKTSPFNWNQVCHGGLTVGSLAVADSDPRYAQLLVVNACRDMPKALASYDPDGAWPEGPGYWGYATDYTVFALAAMESALGTDFGLGKSQGLGNAGFFPVSSRGPSGLLPNFADVGERSRFNGSPLLFWLGNHYHQEGLCGFERDALVAKRATVLDLIWYVPPGSDSAKLALPLDRKFDGQVALATMRSSWDDPGALFAYVKAGYNEVNHGHLDLGSFEFDALGERWARDLGSDDYNMPGYFSGHTKGPRWQYYRLNSHSHSVPLLDGKDQLVTGKATLAKFTSTPDAASAIVDLSGAYGEQAKSVQRGLALVDHRRALLVQDEFVLSGTAAITWAMTTDAKLALSGSHALLTIAGKELEATILSPDQAVFSEESAEQKAPQHENKGVGRLLIALPASSGTVRVAVLFAPRWPSGGATTKAEVKPLAQW